jgi:hypothetical protein
MYSELTRCVELRDGKQLDFIFNSVYGTALDASNRYFTSRTIDPYGQPLSVDSTIDPHGTLTQLSNGDLFYGEDNVVLYMERIQDGDGKVR